MTGGPLALPLTATWLLAVVYTVAGLMLVAVVWPPRRRRRWWLRIAVTVVVGVVVGALTAWLLVDVAHVVDPAPTLVDLAWVVAVSAAVVTAVVVCWRTSVGKRIVAGLGVVSFVLAGAVAINRDADAYQTLAAALGHRTITALDTSALQGTPASSAFDQMLYQHWNAPADMPSEGRFGAVDIPGTVSHFPARNAVVYLPPAALVRDPPALPVIVVFSGQPANPDMVVSSGHLVETLDALAAEHDGLAPIAVIPDQLSDDDHNPMCVDGPLGNSATYITTDVVRYVEEHYPVASGPRAWSTGGFSQGGTCSLQFAAARPDLFGAVVDVAGELGPGLGSREKTIAEGFGGDTAAYEAAQPSALLAGNAPYRDSVAFFAVGANDREFARALETNADAAHRAGMQVTRYTVAGSGHDWTTAAAGLAAGIAHLYPRMGLSRAAGDRSVTEPEGKTT